MNQCYVTGFPAGLAHMQKVDMSGGDRGYVVCLSGIVSQTF